MKPYTIRCTNCNVKNRIPADRLDQAAKCGRCKSPMDLSALTESGPVVVSDKDFAESVLQSPIPVLVYCWSPSCGPCKMMEPDIKSMAIGLKGRVRIARYNVEQNILAAQRYDVLSTPSLLVFDGGRLVDTLIGAHPKEAVIQRLARVA